MLHAAQDIPKNESSNDFLTHLSGYKEFIAILVFFLGGAMWIYGFFATKQQLDEFVCVTNSHLSVLRESMRTDKLIEQLTSARMSLEKLYLLENLAEKEIKIKVSLEAKIEILKNNLQMANQNYENAIKKLEENRC